jgi:hypothetical protein
MRNTFTLTVLSILLSTQFIFAQSKVTRYCEVETSNYYTTLKRSNEKFMINLRLGENEQYFKFKDSTTLCKLRQISVFKTNVDILNYMNSIGWNLISSNSSYSRKYFYFKRDFDISDFQ